jgi:hypothetical protein
MEREDRERSTGTACELKRMLASSSRRSDVWKRMRMWRMRNVRWWG